MDPDKMLRLLDAREQSRLEGGPPGRCFGKYVQAAIIGEGGHSDVFVAWDPENAVEVAIKAPKQGADVSVVSNLGLEELVTRHIESANVIRSLGYGTEAGRPFVVFELVAGGSLRDLLRREGPLAPVRACLIVAGAARGTAALHECSLGRHGDIKPDNILLDADEIPKLSDFGTWRQTLATSDGRGGWLRRADQVLEAASEDWGTDGYRDPDGVGGRRRDIFALGVVLYACLAGRVPLPPEGVRHEDWLLKDGVPLPQALRAVLAQCWAKAPVQFESAEELALALENVGRQHGFAALPAYVPCRAEPPMAVERGSGRRGAAPDRLRTLFYTLGLVAFVVVIAVGVMVLVRLTDTPPAGGAATGPTGQVSSVGGTRPPSTESTQTLTGPAAVSGQGGAVSPRPVEPTPPHVNLPPAPPPATSPPLQPSATTDKAEATPANPVDKDKIANGLPPRPKAGDRHALDFRRVDEVGAPVTGSIGLVWVPPMPGAAPGDAEGFWIGETEVTQGEWHAVTGSRLTIRDPKLVGDDLPAVYVSPGDVDRFCGALRRMTGQEVWRPTEAEWKYAAGWGATGKFISGDAQADLDRHAWYFDNSPAVLKGVKLRGPSPLGLYDILGNAAELVAPDGTGATKAMGGHVHAHHKDCTTTSSYRLPPNRVDSGMEAVGLRIIVRPAKQ